MRREVAFARHERALIVIAGVAALLLTAWLAMGQTLATFSDTTENPDNAFSTAHVELTDDRNGVAMFNVSDLVPGASVQQEITVSNNGSTSLDVKLYTAAFEEIVDTSSGRTTTGLAENLQVFVEVVDTASGTSLGTVFDGTMADFATATDWASGHSVAVDGDPLAASGESGSTQRYRFTVTLSESAALPEEDVGANDEVRVTFVWEGRA